MKKIQRILFALILLVAYPAIADMAARAETLPGTTRQSLQSQPRALSPAPRIWKNENAANAGASR